MYVFVHLGVLASRHGHFFGSINILDQADRRFTAMYCGKDQNLKKVMSSCRLFGLCWTGPNFSSPDRGLEAFG